MSARMKGSAVGEMTAALKRRRRKVAAELGGGRHGRRGSGATPSGGRQMSDGSDGGGEGRRGKRKNREETKEEHGGVRDGDAEAQRVGWEEGDQGRMVQRRKKRQKSRRAQIGNKDDEDK